MASIVLMSAPSLGGAPLSRGEWPFRPEGAASPLNHECARQGAPLTRERSERSLFCPFEVVALSTDVGVLLFGIFGSIICMVWRFSGRSVWRFSGCVCLGMAFQR